jgi:non-lysosomal glucosylceramidase
MRPSGRVFPPTATQAAFLLRGIGSGNFSLGGRGELCDREIFNKPAKGKKLPYSFFAIRFQGVKSGRLMPLSRVLEAPAQPPNTDPLGLHSGTVADCRIFSPPGFAGSIRWFQSTLQTRVCH